MAVKLYRGLSPKKQEGSEQLPKTHNALRIFSWGLILFALPCSAVAQSLGDLGRAERLRKSKQTKPPASIRNEDLKHLNSGRVSQSNIPVAPLEPAPAAAPDSETKAEGEAHTTPTSTQQYWKQLFHDARLQLKLTQNSALVLELRVNELRNRFFVERDGSARAAIEADMVRLATEFEASKGSITKAEKALRALEERARSESVPAAWIREEASDKEDGRNRPSE